IDGAAGPAAAEEEDDGGPLVAALPVSRVMDVQLQLALRRLLVDELLALGRVDGPRHGNDDHQDGYGNRIEASHGWLLSDTTLPAVGSQVMPFRGRRISSPRWEVRAGSVSDGPLPSLTLPARTEFGEAMSQLQDQYQALLRLCQAASAHARDLPRFF